MGEGSLSSAVTRIEERGEGMVVAGEEHVDITVGTPRSSVSPRALGGAGRPAVNDRRSGGWPRVSHITSTCSRQATAGQQLFVCLQPAGLDTKRAEMRGSRTAECTFVFRRRRRERSPLSASAPAGGDAVCGNPTPARVRLASAGVLKTGTTRTTSARLRSDQSRSRLEDGGPR